MKRFAQQVARIRHERGLSLREVARMAGLSYERVSDAERGEVLKFTSAIRLARALGPDVGLALLADLQDALSEQTEPKLAQPQSCAI